jgi:hypothetical protein
VRCADVIGAALPHAAKVLQRSKKRLRFAFGRARKKWLRTFLDLKHGIPTHDTLGRVFAALEPKALSEAFRRWALSVARLTRGEVVAIDGKTLRRSFKDAGKSAFVD